MLNTAPPARYDLPWKAALSHALRPFMDFYFPDFSARIDWRQRPRFRDKELARSGFGAKPDLMVADKLVEVCLHEGGGRRVLIHIEIQAQRDTLLGRRMRDYHDRISEAYGLPVVSLALLADEHPHWRPKGFHQRLHNTVTDFSFGTAKLLDFAADIRALEASRNPIAWVTLAHARTQQAHHDPDKLYAAKLHLTELLFLHRWGQKRIIVLFNVINWMMALPEPYERRYRHVMDRWEKERGMKKLYNSFEQMIINDAINVGLERGLEQGLERGLEKGLEQGLEKGLEKGLEQGLEKGLEQGLERGRREGAVVLLERLLVQRFGPLPQTVHKKLAKASLSQLEAWSDALAAAQSLKQVLG
ncbi:DUF4351 domain-containing protein [Duganella sp. FT135W]|uniref:DUF4351 domain-containing protein n=1 Tax=Duganella flavida TaxID=2692175 RepID=A0A6L8K676_9BURK|nr:DUF4351 domain-containing protein [Duganella flavida]MYM22750.1 DUF4351 domain-containing protein [Duganella flavida]